MVILLLALLPCIVLMVAVYRQDRVEREPVRLLIKLFIMGCVSTIPAIVLELTGGIILDASGLSIDSTLYQALSNFVIIACVEEGLKYLGIRLGSWKNPNFNYIFDGIVYAVFVSLGFAAVENIIYVSVYGTGVALLRAVTAVPLHCITGIFMGHYYGLAKKCEGSGDIRGRKRNLRLSFWIPVFLHGLYDYYVGIAGGGGWTFLVIVFLLDIRVIRRVRKYARADAPVSDAEIKKSGAPIAENPVPDIDCDKCYDNTEEYLQKELYIFAERNAYQSSDKG